LFRGDSLISAILVTLGAATRLSAALFVLCHSYRFLLLASHYLNHEYLIGLLGVWLCVVPHSALSVDAWWQPSSARSSVPRYARAALVAQLTLVYTFSAFAKVNSDWLRYQTPLRHWFAVKAEAWPSWIQNSIDLDSAVRVIAWGGLAFDLTVAPALLWRRSRPWALPALLVFHGANALWFSIGVFPWLMLALSTAFFDPSWPRRLPVIGRFVSRWLSAKPLGQPLSAHRAAWTYPLSGLWFAFQLVLPLRHWLYPGDVAWTEEGHQYAWRMMLRTKRGSVRYRVLTRDGHVEEVDPRAELTLRQYRKLVGQPELIRQYAWWLRERRTSPDGVGPQIFADAWASLNYRPLQRLIDPAVDLSREPASWLHSRWILDVEWAPPPRDP
jgi:vitamin K-dependent gamma-carboxylase